MASASDFHFDGNPVGTLDETALPSTPGRIRYAPYRSFGHQAMQGALKRGAAPECTFHDGNDAFVFRVRACPEHGVLEIDAPVKLAVDDGTGSTDQ